jgi:hypothetical protein
MILASIIAIIIALIVTVIVARMLYRFSYKRGTLDTRKDKVINGVVVGLTFFCVSSFVYVGFLNVF